MKAFSRQIKLSLAFALWVSLLCSIGLISSAAQTRSKQREALPPWQVKNVGPRQLTEEMDNLDFSASPERVIENQIPPHLPIKVELKNLETEPLLRNLQIKVTNTANKPIYFLELDILLPGVKLGAYGIIFPLRYGRMELINYDEPVRAEDTPINPGESYVFTVPKENMWPLKTHPSGINLPTSKIRMVYLIFQEIIFGDKTGFVTTGGLPTPNPH